MESTLKTLRSELKLNATQMKGNSESLDLLKNRQSLLKSELAASREKTVLLNGKLTEAKKVFGENSTEVQNLNRKLTEAKNVEAAIQNELGETNAKIKEQEQANSSLEQSISQADGKLQQFDKELQLNATRLEGTADKTDLLKERQKLLSDQSKASSDKVKTLEKALEACAEEVGENSEEYAELKSRLTEAKTEQAEIQNAIRDTTKELKEQKTQVQKIGDGFKTFGEGAEKAGQSMKGLSTGAAAALAGTGAAAISFESSFAGVTKTVDEVYDANGRCTYSYKELEDGIRSMAKEIPASVTEISGVAEAAGQLGIKTEDILGFTRVMIDLGESTNLSSDTAATSIAKFANVTGMAADESMSAKEKYGRLGSVLVDLGNKYATTEADIMDMAQNLASAGSQVGMSESDILALATSLSSVGLEAQAGGTAFSRAIIEMQLAVETNSDSLQDWASVAGMSTDEFAAAFRDDATGALQAFIEGLAKCGGETDSAIKVLDDMGITETRMRDALLRSANASDIFTSAIQTGKGAWEENSALTKEAEKRYETTASQLTIMKNHIQDAGITLGSVFLPILAEVADKVSGFADKIAGLDKDTQVAILGVTIFVAVLSPLLILIGKISTGISAIIGVGSKLAGLFAGAGAAATEGGAAAAAGMSAPLVPILGIIGGIAAVIGILVLLWNKSEEFREFFTGMWEGFKETIEGFKEKFNLDEKIESIKDKFSGLGEKLAGLGDLFEVIGRVAAAVVVPALGILAGIFGAVVNAIEPLLTIVGGIIDTLSGLESMIVGVFTGDMDKAREGAETFKSGIGDVFGGLWDLVLEALEGFIDGIVSFFESLIEACGIDTFIDGVVEKFNSIVDTVSGVFETIWNVIQVGIMFIGEIFSAAFEIVTAPFRFIWENCKSIIMEAWDAISEKVSGAVNTVQSVISTGFELAKTYIINPISQAYESVRERFESIKAAISEKVEAAKTVISNGFEAAKTKIITPISDAYSSVKTTFGNIKDAISDKINAAKDAVGSAIDKIKGFFNFSWKLPDLKLPHPKVTGEFSLNPPSVPHFDIEWYKTGAIFTRPTIFGTATGLKGVGEAGAEAVLPIRNLREYVEESMINVLSMFQQGEDPIDYDRLAYAMAQQEIKLIINEREAGKIRREIK